MSMKKYHGDRGGDRHDNQNLFWPGTLDGFPAIGPSAALAGDLKKEEFENLELRYDFKSKMFELWDVSQKAEFDDINDRIVNGWYYLQKRSDHWDDEHKHYRVWLEWCQVYGMVPTAK